MLERDVWRTDKDVAINRVEICKDAVINRNEMCCCVDKGTDKILQSLNHRDIRDLEVKNIELKDKINKLEMEKYIDHKFDKVYAENCKLSCEIKETAGIAGAAVQGVRHLEHSLLHECVKPSGTMVFPDYCAEKGFRNETTHELHRIIRDVEFLKRDFEHRHHNHNQNQTTTATTPAA